MNKPKIFSIICALGTIALPISTALAATNTAVTTPAAKSAAVSQAATAAKSIPATKVTPATKAAPIVLPATTQWTLAGNNSHFIVSFDEKNLKYDKKTGIITAWTKWESKSAGSKQAKYIYLLSQYDIRLKTYANLQQINTLATGEVLSAGKVSDTSWHTVTLGTLGEDICTALNNYFLAN